MKLNSRSIVNHQKKKNKKAKRRLNTEKDAFFKNDNFANRNSESIFSNISMNKFAVNNEIGREKQKSD
jgi:hypothetical protein